MDRFYYENPDVNTLNQFTDLSLENYRKINNLVGGLKMSYVELIDAFMEDEELIGSRLMGATLDFHISDKKFERVTVGEQEDEWFYVEVYSYENGSSGPRFLDILRTYRCDGFDGLKKLFMDLGFSKIRESRSTTDYMLISDSESDDFFERRDSVSINEREYGILKRIVRKKKGDFKYEVLYEEQYVGGIVGEEKEPLHNIEIQGRSDPRTTLSMIDNYYISKYDDDWFHVSCIKKKEGRKRVRTNYRCDQFEGVVELLSDLDMVHQKYKK